MIHGIINVYKEAGFTSFDVVAKLRGICGQKKIGHTGTLDPAAEGVLPVCFGNGTKLCDMLTDRTKEYEAVLLLGVTTDTLDMEGTILQEQEVTCTEEEACEAVRSFVGSYDQIPPMYSALKVEGKRLYELAREGVEIERKARRIEIYKIDILSIELPRIRMRVNCSKGTYIRSLCKDIGDKLGCGGAMEKLVRTKSGIFTLEDAKKLSEIEQMKQNGELDQIVHPLEEILQEYRPYHVKPEYKKLIDNGNPLPYECFEENPKDKQDVIQDVIREDNPKDNQDVIREGIQKEIQDNEKIRVYNVEGRFFAIYQYKEQSGLFMPDKIFPIQE